MRSKIHGKTNKEADADLVRELFKKRILGKTLYQPDSGLYQNVCRIDWFKLKGEDLKALIGILMGF